MKIDTPNKVINYYKWLKFNNLAVCDGISEPVSIQSILYPIFIITGIVFILEILNRYEWIKEKIKGKK